MKTCIGASIGSFVFLLAGCGTLEGGGDRHRDGLSDNEPSANINFPSLRQAQGQQLSFETDGLTDSVSEFNGALQVTVPVFRVGHHTGKATYRAEGLDHGGWFSPNIPNTPNHIPGVTATTFYPSPITYSGMPFQWHRPWLARFRYHRNRNTAFYGLEGQGASVEFSDGHVETVFSGSVPNNIGIPGASPGTQFRYTSGLSKWWISETSPPHVMMRTRDGTLYVFNRGSCFQGDFPNNGTPPAGADDAQLPDAVCEPTRIEDTHGNGLRVVYYGTSDSNAANDTYIPRVIESYRTDSSGAQIVTARAYFYLDGSFSGTPSLSEPADVLTGDANTPRFVGAIAYPGPSSNPLSIDASWHHTYFNLGNAPEQASIDPDSHPEDGLFSCLMPTGGYRRALAEIRTEGRGYKFNYGAHRGFHCPTIDPAAAIGSSPALYGRMSRIELWNGQSIAYNWRSIAVAIATGDDEFEAFGQTYGSAIAMQYVPAIAVRRFSHWVRDARQEQRWDFVHSNTTVNGARYHVTGVAYPTGSSSVAYFHPLASYQSPASARTGLVADRYTYLEEPTRWDLAHINDPLPTNPGDGLVAWTESHEAEEQESHGYAVFAVGTTLLDEPTRFDIRVRNGNALGLNNPVLVEDQSYHDYVGWVIAPGYDVTTRAPDDTSSTSWCNMASASASINSVSCIGTGVVPAAPCASGDGSFSSEQACHAASASAHCYSVSFGGQVGWCGSFDGAPSGSLTCPAGTLTVSSCSGSQESTVVQGHSVVRQYRENRPSEFYLQRFAQNGRSDHDIYLNTPFVRNFGTENPVLLRRNSANCDTQCQREEGETFSCEENWTCRQDTIEAVVPSSAELGSENRRTYWIEDSANESYEALNLTSLIAISKQCRIGSACNEGAGLIGQSEMYYDNRGLAYPFADAPGDGSIAPTGRLTAVRSLLLSNPNESPVTYSRFYGRENPTDQPSGALAETALTVSSGVYQRSRMSYIGNTSGSHAPTEIRVLNDSGTFSVVAAASFDQWGHTLSSRDENDQTTHFCFDELGRPRATFASTDAFSGCPSGSASFTSASSEISYLDNPQGYADFTRVSLQTQRTRFNSEVVSNTTAKFYDGMGRTVEERTQRSTDNGSVILARSYQHFANTSLPTIATEAQVLQNASLTTLSGSGFSGPKVVTSYDTFGRPTETIRHYGVESGYQVSARYAYPGSPGMAWNQVRITDAQGAVTDHRLDLFDRLQRTDLPSGTSVQRHYDSAGLLDRVTSPDGALTTAQFDSLGRRIAETTPEGGTVAYGYDRAGRMTSLLRPEGTELRNLYDARGRITRRQRKQGTQWTTESEYRYDTHPGDTSISATEFALGRVTSIAWNEGRYDYGYDAHGNVVEQTTTLSGLPLKRSVLARDSSGGVRRLNYQAGQPDAFAARYAVNANGELDTITAQNLAVVSNRYDTRGRLAQRELMPGPTPAQVQDFSYSAFSELRSVNDPSNLGTDAFAYTLRYEAPVLGGTARLDSIPSEVEWARPGASRAAYVLSYDSIGQLTQADFREHNGSSWQNPVTYDFHAAFNSSGNPEYLRRYRDTGALDATEYSYSGRRLDATLGANAASFAYNAAGNLTENSAWNGNGRVRYNSAERPVALANGQNQLEIGYDAAQSPTRLVREHYVTPCPAVPHEPNDIRRGEGGGRGEGAGGGTPVIQRGCYVADSTTHIVRDPTGAPIAEYVDGALERFVLPQVGYMQPRNGGFATFFALTDHVGSVRVVVNQLGQLVEAHDFDPFGVRLSGRDFVGSSNSSVTFGGMRPRDDMGSELLLAGARVYSPQLGRFLSRDRLAQLDSIGNAYAYARNSPMALNDPTGLCPTCTGGPTDPEPTYYGGTLPEVVITASRITAPSSPTVGEQVGGLALGVGVGYGTGVAANVILTGVLGSNPIGWGIVAVIAIGYGGYQLYNHWDDITAGAERVTSGEGTFQDFFTLGTLGGGGASGYVGKGFQTELAASLSASLGRAKLANATTSELVAESAALARGARDPYASTPVGRNGAEMRNPSYQPVQNVETVIGGRTYSGHALDQMRNRGFTPTVIEDAIQSGRSFAGNRENTIGYYSAANNLRVIVNSTNGNVITTIPGSPGTGTLWLGH